MNKKIVELIATSLQIKENQVINTVELLEEGATVPFIARYRKEKTGSLEDFQIIALKEQLEKFKEVEKRRESVITSIGEQGKLTPELKQKLLQTWLISELEDLYLPYKPKKKSKASVARKKGLEPLAKMLMKQDVQDVFSIVVRFVKDEVGSETEALQGARDIIAEWVNESLAARDRIRNLFEREAIITSTVIKTKKEEAINYKDYFSYSEKASKIPSHRMLAIRRGEEEGFLRINIVPPEDLALQQLERIFIKGNNESSKQVAEALIESYKRLLKPSIETEFRNSSKEKADEEAIRVFAENLKQLLLASPLGQKRILAIDPGFKSGCKLVCLDQQGNLLHNENIYPHAPQKEGGKAAAKISTLVSTYNIDAIAIGNGTASRETEYFIQKIHFNKKVQVFVVSEAGASIYSASAVAREEFPQYDVTVRGAVSIGRRLMDPLAELVKIDARSIGVGQYQHDVDQQKLKQSLDYIVEFCVNSVGINLNTASKHLLAYVSGIGPSVAQNIIEYRKQNGPFNSRQELRKVPRLGDKVFEQCAGFLRIRNNHNPLDNSAVHPESYKLVEKMAKDLNCKVEDLINEPELRNKISPENYVTEKFGLPTITDILKELAKPGLDPRTIIRVFEFAKGINKVEQLEIGMELPGIVTNITNFGAFVDVGVKQDGLVHISQLADAFVKNPADIVKLHQHVKVKVLEVDIQRKRLAYTMKGIEQPK
jgi:protein Tex